MYNGNKLRTKVLSQSKHIIYESSQPGILQLSLHLNN